MVLWCQSGSRTVRSDPLIRTTVANLFLAKPFISVNVPGYLMWTTQSFHGLNPNNNQLLLNPHVLEIISNLFLWIVLVEIKSDSLMCNSGNNSGAAQLIKIIYNRKKGKLEEGKVSFNAFWFIHLGILHRRYLLFLFPTEKCFFFCSHPNTNVGAMNILGW